VGGGPGGLVAALTAAERGMQVDLWEKTNQLGGLLLAAGGPIFKKDVKDYVDYLVGKIYRSNINVSLMKEATPDNVLSGNYDKVIVATGADPVMPNIEGIDKDFVVGANDLLTNKESYGKNVVVIGGGLVGCETACHVAEKAENVTIIEMLPEILMTVNHSRNNDQALRALMEECEIKAITNAKVVAFKDNEVVYEINGEQKSIQADTVAIAAGYRSRTSLYDQIIDKVDCQIVGDAERPDNILTAVHHGFNSVRCI
ncbi:MAG: FAD-dependent oxidoreductase, partial [Clostridiales bacterium]|nr:FAD-dependent oxidoreductase [Clostridiales bacterium]